MKIKVRVYSGNAEATVALQHHETTGKNVKWGKFHRYDDTRQKSYGILMTQKRTIRTARKTMIRKLRCKR